MGIVGVDLEGAAETGDAEGVVRMVVDPRSGEEDAPVGQEDRVPRPMMVRGDDVSTARGDIDDDQRLERNPAGLGGDDLPAVAGEGRIGEATVARVAFGLNLVEAPEAAAGEETEFVASGLSTDDRNLPVASLA